MVNTENRNNLKWLDVLAIFCLAVLPDLANCLVLVGDSSVAESTTFTQLLFLLLVRSVQVSVPILLIMRLRNVCWQNYGFVAFRPDKDFLIAIGLAVITYAVFYTIVLALYNFGINYENDPNSLPQPTSNGTVSLSTVTLILAASVANGFAEELAMRSYLVTRVTELLGSAVVAVVVISVLFALYHSYQGRYGVISALVAGLVFGTYFAQTKRFWPIMISHFLLDAYPLTLMAAGAE